MTERFTGPYIYFFEPDDLDTALSDSAGSYDRPVYSLEVTQNLDGPAKATVTIPVVSTYGELEAEGNVVIFAYRDEWYDKVMWVAEGYEIKSMETYTVSGGTERVDLQCESLVARLADRNLYNPIAKETIYSTTVKSGAAVAQIPSATTLANTGTPEADTLTLASIANFNATDLVAITMDDGGTWVTSVTAVDTDTKVITLEHALPSTATSGNAINRYPRKVLLNNDAGLYVGATIRLTLANASVFVSVAESTGTETDNDGNELGTYVVLRDGITSQYNTGGAVNILNYDEPADDNLDQFEGLSGWVIVGASSTAIKTRHAPDGSTFLEVLASIVKATNEHWRVWIDAANGKPVKSIKWINTSGEDSGASQKVNFQAISSESEADYYYSTQRDDIAIVYGNVRAKRIREIYTRAYPSAADDSISLTQVSDEIESYLALNDYIIVDEQANLATYEPPYIKHATMEASIGIRSKTLGLSHISAESMSSATTSAAADQMAIETMQWLKSHATTYVEIAVDDVLWNSSAPPYAGQLVMLSYNSKFGSWWQETWDNSPSLVIKSCTLRWTQEGPRWDFTLANRYRAPDDAAQGLANRIGNLDTIIRRASIGTINQVNDRAVIERVAGTGTGDYVTTATFAAHAADVDAHQALVTTLAPLSVTGQQVSLNYSQGLAVDGSNNLVINYGAGLTLDGNTLRMGTPTTLSAGTTNWATGTTHSHAITSYSDGRSKDSQLLRTGTGTLIGSIALNRLAINSAGSTSNALYVIAGQTSDNSVTIKQLASQTGDMLSIIDSNSNQLIRLTHEGVLESGNPAFVSGQTGWQIEPGGDVEFNNAVIRGELHAATFVADEIHATGGTLAVMTTAKVTNPLAPGDNVLGALGASFPLVVQASYNTYACYFSVDDMIRIKVMGEIASGGSLDLYDIYAQVTAVSVLQNQDLPNGDPGSYTLTCTLRSGGETGFVIPTGSAAVKWGEVNGSPGSFTGGMILTSDLTQSPYLDIFTVPSDTLPQNWPATPTPRVRVGNLDGVLGLSQQWGIAAGTNLATSATTTTNQYFVASDQQFKLQNIDITLYDSGQPTVWLSSSGEVRFGTDIEDEAATNFRFNVSSKNIRLGPYATGKPNLLWDQVAGELQLRIFEDDKIILDSSGNAYFAGVMTIGTLGEIRQGSGTAGTTGSWSSPWGTFTGLRIGRESGVGRLATYNAGAPQVYFDTTGALVAGAGDVMLDADGLRLGTATTVKSSSAITWLNTSDAIYGGIYGTATASVSQLYMEAKSGSISSKLNLYVSSGVMFSELSSGTTKLTLSSNWDYAMLTDADFYIRERGLAVGYPSNIPLNRGQIASDFAGEHDFNAIVLQDSVDIAHGMTTVVATDTYAAFGKLNNTNGGLNVYGMSEGAVGMSLQPHATTTDSNTTTSATGAMVINSFKKNGTGTTSFGVDDNLLVVRNASTTRLIVKGDGDLRYDGTASAYDDYDDVALLRAADLSLAGRLDAQWEGWLSYNQDDLQRAGIISIENNQQWVSSQRLQRLAIGAIWQLHERIDRLEEALLQ